MGDFGVLGSEWFVGGSGGSVLSYLDDFVEFWAVNGLCESVLSYLDDFGEFWAVNGLLVREY